MRFRPFALERYFARYEFNVRYVLCASDCRTRTVGDLMALEPSLSQRLGALKLGYVDSRGTPSLREGVATMYSSINPEQVLVHAGAQEAILWFYFALLAAGDEVIVHSPCYASHREVPLAIVVNMPHNPTGYSFDSGQFTRLCGFAVERGIVLFSDEVFRESEHSEADLLPAACDLADSAVSLG